MLHRHAIIDASAQHVLVCIVSTQYWEFLIDNNDSIVSLETISDCLIPHTVLDIYKMTLWLLLKFGLQIEIFYSI